MNIALQWEGNVHELPSESDVGVVHFHSTEARPRPRLMNSSNLSRVELEQNVMIHFVLQDKTFPPWLPVMLP